MILVLIPVVAIAGGRWWPFWQVLPLTIIPIAGKTIRDLVSNNVDANVTIGSICYGVIPVSVGMALAMWAGQDSRRNRDGHAFVRWALLVTTWTYFSLNFPSSVILGRERAPLAGLLADSYIRSLYLALQHWFGCRAIGSNEQPTSYCVLSSQENRL